MPDSLGQSGSALYKWPSQFLSGLREITFYEGAGRRIRTDDLVITNQLLYQLSYAGKLKIGSYSFRPRTQISEERSAIVHHPDRRASTARPVNVDAVKALASANAAPIPTNCSSFAFCETAGSRPDRCL